MVSVRTQKLVTRRDELLRSGRRLSRSEVQEVNEAQTSLRNERGVSYSQAPDYKYSDGQLRAKQGIGGFNTESADPEVFEKTGETVVRREGYTYRRNADGSFETVERPAEQQSKLDETIAMNSRINQGERVKAKELAYGEEVIDLTDSRTSAQAGAVEYQRREQYNRDEQTKAQKKADERSQSAYEGSLAFAGLRQVATSERGNVVYSYDQDKVLLESLSRPVGSNIMSSSLFPYNPRARLQSSIGANMYNTREERLRRALARVGDFGRVAPTKPLINSMNEYTIGRRISDNRNSYVLSTIGLATTLIPGLALPKTVGALSLGYGLFQTTKDVQTIRKTGRGYGKLAGTVALTAVDAILLKSALSQVTKSTLLSRRLVGETAFEFTLPTRATVRGSPVLGKQQNIVSLRLQGQQQGIDFMSRQRFVRGSRTLAFEETYNTIFGKQRATRLIRQDIKIKDFQIKGSNTPEDFEIALTGQAKVTINQKTLTLPASQFGVSRSDLINPRTIGIDVLSRKGVSAEFARRQMFSIKDADLSTSPFPVFDDSLSGRAFVTGRITPIQPNVASIGLRTVTRLGSGSDAQILRDEQRFLNEIQQQKPEFSYTGEAVFKDSFSLNPVDVIAQTRPRILSPEAKRIGAFGFVQGNRPASYIYLDASYGRPTLRDTSYHEAGHLFDFFEGYERGIIGSKGTLGLSQVSSRYRYNAFSKEIKRDPKLQKEFYALSNSGLTEDISFYSNYNKGSYSEEMFAEITKARALNPTKFKEKAPTFDSYLSVFDAPVKLSYKSGIKNIFETSGRTPTRTLTAVDSETASGELLSRELSRVTRIGEVGETTTSTLLMQRGTLRRGATPQSPLLDIEEFKPYTDTLTSRLPRPPTIQEPPQVPSVLDQFGVSQEIRQAEQLANAQSPQVNIFDTLTKQERVSQRQFAQQLSRLSVQPSFTNVLAQVTPRRVTGRQATARINSYLGASLGGTSSAQFLNAQQSPRLQQYRAVSAQYRSQVITDNYVPNVLQQRAQGLTATYRPQVLTQARAMRDLLQQTRSQSKLTTRARSQSRLLSQLQSRLATQQVSQLSTQQLTRQLTRQATRQLTRQATRQLTRQSTRQVTRQVLKPLTVPGIPRLVFPPFQQPPTPTVPVLPRFPSKQYGNIFKAPKQSRRMLRYTQSIGAIFDTAPLNFNRKSISAYSGIGVRF